MCVRMDMCVVCESHTHTHTPHTQRMAVTYRDVISVTVGVDGINEVHIEVLDQSCHMQTVGQTLRTSKKTNHDSTATQSTGATLAWCMRVSMHVHMYVVPL
jgi:hypothetical protein